MAFQLVAGPVNEPISEAQAKAHLRVDVGDDDDLISSCIVAARQTLESNYEIAIITQTWNLILDSFPGLQAFPWASMGQLGRNRPIEIPKPPLQSVTSITYIDSTGTPAVFPLANCITDTATFVGRIGLVLGQSWPTVTLQPINGVVIRFVAGYGNDWPSVPAAIRQAMLLMVGHYYENREQVLLEQRVRAIDIPRGVDDLMNIAAWRYFVA
jgi:uncharacterized phiE125 gp8 family phage protein